MPLLHASWSTRQSANIHKDSVTNKHEPNVDPEKSAQGGCEGCSVSAKNKSLPFPRYRQETSEIRALNVDRGMLIGRIKKEQSPTLFPPGSVSLPNNFLHASAKVCTEKRTKQH